MPDSPIISGSDMNEIQGYCMSRPMMESISSDSQIVGTIPGALGKPGTLLEMQSLTDLTESENLGVCFNKSTE